ncbi:hypothetical protein ACIOZL_27100 [Streptomyces sp. NPDC087769]|uniref:hypothetical protein n=1 Tax=Streptomyces sp. NPDC087769 TaxID=3365802 RepID=UPI0037F59547
MPMITMSLATLNSHVASSPTENAAPEFETGVNFRKPPSARWVRRREVGQGDLFRCQIHGQTAVPP